MQRIRTRAQFQAAMAGGTVSRTPHFVLHRAALDAAVPDAPPPPDPPPPALFRIHDTHIGVVVPKRWAKRAVTRNGIKRQIYAVSATFQDRLPAAALVVRLRVGFPGFTSAWSEGLKKLVRAELQQLFAAAAAPATRPEARACP
ncbi:ribonuclease P protein component [Ramlibacter sp.]|uniref:ribonuclease P protein component n=1 Tax=Ramlibacter sp. TaxID=1917967 RepID=UPI003D0B22F5